jgi:predicted ATPase
MLKRIYIDNFRCLVNFDLTLDRISLLLGLNGSGKSTVFEVLNILQKFIGGQARVDDVFPESTRTRWERRLDQTFELEVDGPQGKFLYRLVIGVEGRRQTGKVKTESLHLDGKSLYFFDEEGQAHLFHDDFQKGGDYPFDWRQSGLGSLPPRRDNTKLTWFKEQIRQYVILALRPGEMRSESRDENDYLLPGAQNFSSWYSYLSQEHQACVHELHNKLADLFFNFRQLHLPRAGEQRLLKAEFTLNDNGETISYLFNELSDGERNLIVLYSLVLAAKEVNYTLFIDEPENYIALPELQPWLMEMSDACQESEMQAVMISHHPEFIDYLGPENRIWLEREQGGPTRVGSVVIPEDSTLTLSELIARGWEHG